jgi:hypothetical protein
MTEESRTFDRETLLDLMVNAIPLGIMLFFIVIFLVINPFGTDLVATTIQMTIIVVTFAALGVLTYISGKVISESEKELEAMEGLEAVSESVGAEEEAVESASEGEESEESAA